MNKTTHQTFLNLYNVYFDKLYCHALRLVGDKSEAEDIIGDVFYELWKRIDTIDLERGIVAYLYRAVTTRALNVLRHRNVAAERIEVLEAISNKKIDFIDRHTPEQSAENNDLKTGIQHALDTLPQKCREVFVQSYLNGHKSKEIAQDMGISVRTVEVHIYKALKIMREKLHYLLSAIICYSFIHF